jgi:poly-gamma-glutamate synthesis protein (capsule biosynthesis protein)
MSSSIIDHFVDGPQSSAATSIVLAGDLVLDVEDPDHWLSGIASALRAADVTIGHLEVPHTRRGTELAGDVPAPGADPDNLSALARAGVTAVTLAGNHISDCGPQGIADTVAILDQLCIAHAGAGPNLQAARAPALIRCGTRQLALLSYNCVGPENGWATATSAGCAYLRMETADGSPVAPNAALVKPSLEAIEMLRTDIAAARQLAQLVIVALHKGIVHTPAQLAPYERGISAAAIDAGADVVVGHHAHIIRGIEFHRGKPIFHGLGNGCVVTRALSPDQDHPARAQWAKRRRQLFGFEPDPEYSLAPFHPEAVNAMLARLLWHPDGRIESGLIPVHIEPPGRPVLADEEQGQKIRNYLEQITLAAGLPSRRFTRRDDMTVVQ